MTRSEIDKLKRLKTYLNKECRALVMRGQPKRGTMFARWAVTVGIAIGANKEYLILKNEKGRWK